jgi:hypothetical protein
MSPFIFIQVVCKITIDPEPSTCEYKQILLCNETAIKIIKSKRKERKYLPRKYMYVSKTKKIKKYSVGF